TQSVAICHSIDCRYAPTSTKRIPREDNAWNSIFPRNISRVNADEAQPRRSCGKNVHRYRSRGIERTTNKEENTRRLKKIATGTFSRRVLHPYAKFASLVGSLTTPTVAAFNPTRVIELKQSSNGVLLAVARLSSPVGSSNQEEEEEEEEEEEPRTCCKCWKISRERFIRKGERDPPRRRPTRPSQGRAFPFSGVYLSSYV
ncbi:hypothetical protein K0M31_000585, partial [Melipona bicolor]